MKTKFQCDFCDSIFDTIEEAEVHEQTHSTEVACTHVGVKDQVDAVCHALNRTDGTELTFKWQRGSKEVKQKFAFDQSVQLRATGVLPDKDNQDE